MLTLERARNDVIDVYGDRYSGHTMELLQRLTDVFEQAPDDASVYGYLKYLRQHSSNYMYRNAIMSQPMMESYRHETEDQRMLLKTSVESLHTRILTLAEKLGADRLDTVLSLIDGSAPESALYVVTRFMALADPTDALKVYPNNYKNKAWDYFRRFPGAHALLDTGLKQLVEECPYASRL